MCNREKERKGNSVELRMGHPDDQLSCQTYDSTVLAVVGLRQGIMASPQDRDQNMDSRPEDTQVEDTASTR